jgi:hypothetical protein
MRRTFNEKGLGFFRGLRALGLCGVLFFVSLMFVGKSHCSDDSSGGEPGFNIDVLAGFVVGFGVGFGVGCTLAFVGYLALSYKGASAEAPLRKLGVEPCSEEALDTTYPTEVELVTPSTPILKGLLESIDVLFKNAWVEWIAFEVATPLSVLILVWVSLYKATGRLAIPTAPCRVVGAYLLSYNLFAFLWILVELFL